MMDDDEDYDCDLADEDLILALDQPKSAAPAQSHSRQTPRANSATKRLSAQFGGLDDLPSDAFDSSPAVRPSTVNNLVQRATTAGRAGAQPSFRQTTLFGQALGREELAQSQANTNRAFRVDLPPEAPSHHALDHEALKTWVYPTNLGPTRDYQFSIVKNGLYNNTLVALPTGLGKTFIAATIILNYYRWTKDAKIIFVAPTKPLVAQQVEACLNVAGIPRSDATLLTGDILPVYREEEWAKRRLFFMTPQTLQNDFGKGYADPKSIVLLVVDEAHRATGDYAYVKIIEFIRRFSKSFRVLALTATPGSTVEGVQDIIDNLGISHVEIRTEESIDIRQYVHSRQIERVVLEPSDEILRIRDLFSKALKPIVDKLSQQNIWWGRDPMAMTTYGLMKARTDWMNRAGRSMNQGMKFMIISIFTILQGLAHSIKLLNYHGIKPFYDNMADFRSSTEDKGEKGSKYKRQLVKDPNFQEMMDVVERWLRIEGFVSHPKITYLCDHLLNHFMDAGEASNTRAIVFSEYRDSAEEIVKTLNKHKPLISAAVFVGQADSKRSEGMKQKQQIETIEKFRTGGFNVLVATSIGEEGLDIGQVDLIVCYDASASPIRMLQRMGRTGRKRAGNIVLLLMKGKEEDKFAEAQDNYAQMQKYICDGSRFNFRHDLSARIVPRDVRPEVDQRFVEIPIENTQNPDLPEPKRAGARTKKKASAKKFHMPDGVETGFMRASAFGKLKGTSTRAKTPEPVETDFLVDKPALSTAVLDCSQTDELNRLYRDLPFRSSDHEEIGPPNMTAHPKLQRTLRPTVALKHGGYTRRCVKMFKLLGTPQSLTSRYPATPGVTDISRYRSLPVHPFADDSDGDDSAGASSRPYKRRRTYSVSAEGDDCDEELDAPAISATTTRRERAPPKPKPKPKSRPSKPPPRVPKRTSNPFIEGDDDDDDDDDEEDEDEAEEQPSDEEDGDPTETPDLPSTRGLGRPRGSRGGRVGRGGRGGRRGGGNATRRADDFEDRAGDDCMRTSDNYESDGSDSGADLVDFIVGSDASLGVGPSSGLPPTSSLPSLPPRVHKKGGDGGAAEARKQPYYVPVQLTQSQESDDEMPDISELVGRTSSDRAEADEQDTVRTRPTARQKRRAAVLYETDSE